MLNVVLAVIAALSLLLAYYVIPYLRSPLKHIPGPFWAKFTNWWRLYNVPNSHRLQIELHRRHGSAVRWGPNCVSLDDPSLVKTIYSVRGHFLKSDFYAVNDVKQDGVLIQNIFGTRSNAFHKKYTRPIQSIYSMRSILALEPLANKTAALFCRRLEEEFINGANADRICNLSDWISFYSWDVDGEVTFDRPFGFLEAGKDLDDWLRQSEAALKHFAIVGQIPALDHWLSKNPVIRLGGVGVGWGVNYSASRLFERYAENARAEKEGQVRESSQRVDFTDYFINLKKEHPDVVDDFTVISYMVLNVLAGADTISATLKATMNFLLTNPSTYHRLVEELDKAHLPDPVPYEQAAELPYLDAVIKEAMRLEPAISMILERIVPEEGLRLSDGRFIPAGTIVGINPWVIGRNRDVFGPDAEIFRPDRWLQASWETEEEFSDRLQAMKAANLSFGAGNRVCIGKNMALMEMYKIIPTLLVRYKWKLANVRDEAVTECKWVGFQSPVHVRLSKR